MERGGSNSENEFISPLSDARALEQVEFLYTKLKVARDDASQFKEQDRRYRGSVLARELNLSLGTLESRSSHLSEEFEEMRERILGKHKQEDSVTEQTV